MGFNTVFVLIIAIITFSSADNCWHTELRPHADCDKFVQCSNGATYVMPCAPGTLFDYDNQICNHAWAVTCTPPEVSTTPDPGYLPNGCPSSFHEHLLLPHEDCSKFYQCVHGNKVEMVCAAGTLFDYHLQVCNWPNQVTCYSPSTTTNDPTTTTQRVITSSTTEQLIEITTEKHEEETETEIPTDSPEFVPENPGFTDNPGLATDSPETTSWEEDISLSTEVTDIPYITTETVIEESQETTASTIETEKSTENYITTENDLEFTTVEPTSETGTLEEGITDTNEENIESEQGLESSDESESIENEDTTETEDFTTIRPIPEATTQAPICPDGFVGNVANPDDCGSYFLCSNGIAIPLYCAEGCKYDSEENRCVVATEGLCAISIESEEVTTENSKENNTDEFENSSIEVTSEEKSSELVTEGTTPNIDSLETSVKMSVENSSETENPIQSTTAEVEYTRPPPTTQDPTTVTENPEYITESPETSSEEGIETTDNNDVTKESLENDNESSEAAEVIEITTEKEDLTTTVRPLLEATTQAPICPAGFFGNVANPDDCSSYYMCSNGIAIPLFCAEGTKYDSDENRCIVATDGPCAISIESLEVTTENSKENNTEELENSSSEVTSEDKSSELGTEGTTPNIDSPETIVNISEENSSETENPIESTTAEVEYTRPPTNQDPTGNPEYDTESLENIPTEEDIPDTTTVEHTRPPTTQEPTTITDNPEYITESPELYSEESIEITEDNDVTKESLENDNKSSEAAEESAEVIEITTEKEDWTTTLRPLEATTLAPICPAGFIGNVANPDDCSSYYMCSNGIAIPLFCAEGTKYDSEENRCIVATDGPCATNNDNQEVATENSKENNTEEFENSSIEVTSEEKSSELVTEGTTLNIDSHETPVNISEENSSETEYPIESTTAEVEYTRPPTIQDSTTVTGNPEYDTESFENIPTEEDITDTTTVEHTIPPTTQEPTTMTDNPEFITESPEISSEEASQTAEDNNVTKESLENDKESTEATEESAELIEITTQKEDWTTTLRPLEATTLAPICPAEFIGNVANSDDCSSYYMCSDGIAIPLFCAEGYMYDSDKGACVQAKEGPCALVESNTNDTESEHTTTENPKTTANYIDESENNSESNESYETTYVENSNESITEIIEITTLTESLETEYTETESPVYEPEQTIEDTWITTESEIPYTETTEDSESTTFTIPDVETTTILPTEGLELTTEDISTTIRPTTEAPLCAVGVIGNVAHPTDCGTYFMCSNGFAIQLFCPDGSEFDSETEICVPIAEGGCTWQQQNWSINDESSNISEELHQYSDEKDDDEKSQENNNSDQTDDESEHNHEEQDSTEEHTLRPDSKEEYSESQENSKPFDSNETNEVIGQENGDDVEQDLLELDDHNDTTTTERNADEPICKNDTLAYVPHPEICHSYYMCTAGFAIQLFCTDGSEFNEDFQQCQPIAEGGCTHEQIRYNADYPDNDE